MAEPGVRQSSSGCYGLKHEIYKGGVKGRERKLDRKPLYSSFITGYRCTDSLNPHVYLNTIGMLAVFYRGRNTLREVD